MSVVEIQRDSERNCLRAREGGVEARSGEGVSRTVGHEVGSHSFHLRCFWTDHLNSILLPEEDDVCYVQWRSQDSRTEGDTSTFSDKVLTSKKVVSLWF